MKLYNLDQHISVNSDLEFIWLKLGHELDIDSISGHSWVLNRERKHVPLVENNIGSIVEKELWREFYSTYGKRLKDYNGFLCCYPPVFALLYKQFTDKRVIVHIPIRYDFPYTDNEPSLKVLNEFLVSDSVIVTANNKLDKAYFEDRTDGKKECKYIPSLCEYTGMKWAPKRSEFLLYDGSRKWQIDNTVNRYVDFHPHTWKDVQGFRGIIHMPYNISTMSMFEQYTACIPLFYPSKEFLLKMYRQKANVLEQCFWSDKQHGKYGYETIEDVLDLADFYSDTFPHIITFDNMAQLDDKRYDDAFLEWTSAEMMKDNMMNRGRVYKAWENVLESVKK